MIDILLMLEYCIYSTVKSSLNGQTKLNVHAPRDGTAAGRHGGAAREHLIFHENCTWVGFFCFVSTGPNMSPTAREQTNTKSRGLTAWFDSSRVNF